MKLFSPYNNIYKLQSIEALHSIDSEITEVAFKIWKGISGIIISEDLAGLSLFYDHTLEELLNIHALLRKITIRQKIDCPWFDADCSMSKRKTRRLERKLNTLQKT